MIITINTKEDTKDEIKRIIAMLSNMINEPIQTQEFNPPAASEGGFFNIFDQPVAPPQPPTEDSEKSARMEIYDY
jgi:hypothetical protein